MAALSMCMIRVSTNECEQEERSANFYYLMFTYVICVFLKYYITVTLQDKRYA